MYNIIDTLAPVQHCLAAGLVDQAKAAKYKMTWNKKFLYWAWRGKFRIINYPEALRAMGQIIGDNYDMKKPGMAQYKKFMPALEKANAPETTANDQSSEDDNEDNEEAAANAIAIVAWSDGVLSQ
jgi:hypothetical protein